MVGKHAGFTLIELLVVVAIISILASIAVPNFLEAQVRAKVARTKADLRSLATVVEMYAVDYNKYPVREAPLMGTPPNTFRDPVPDLQEKIYNPTNPAAAEGMHMLTTPIAYISSLPKDVFNIPALALMAQGNPYSDCLDYWDSNQVFAWLVGVYNTSMTEKARNLGYVLFSVGPDQYLGQGGPANNYPSSTFTFLTYQLPYDPTNGTVSTGNIQRFASLSAPSLADMRP